MANVDFSGAIPLVQLDIPVDEPDAGSIYADLKKAIEAQVKRDGIDPASVQPYELESDILNNAVSNIYHDVVGMENWVFEEADDDFEGRKAFLSLQKTTGSKFTGPIYNAIKKAVIPVVGQSIVDMRDSGEIPVDQDHEGLADKLTDALTAYIINWQDWYYERKEDQAIDAYYDSVAEYTQSYLDSDYGDLSNLLDDSQYDEASDVPYLSD